MTSESLGGLLKKDVLPIRPLNRYKLNLLDLESLRSLKYIPRFSFFFEDYLMLSPNKSFVLFARVRLASETYEQWHGVISTSEVHLQSLLAEV